MKPRRTNKRSARHHRRANRHRARAWAANYAERRKIARRAGIALAVRVMWRMTRFAVVTVPRWLLKLARQRKTRAHGRRVTVLTENEAEVIAQATERRSEG